MNKPVQHDLFKVSQAVPTTPQWEATKAKMALLNLSEAEIIAALWRMPLPEREDLFHVLIGTHVRGAWNVPPISQAPLQLPFLQALDQNAAVRHALESRRTSAAASILLALTTAFGALTLSVILFGIIKL